MSSSEYAGDCWDDGLPADPPTRLPDADAATDDTAPKHLLCGRCYAESEVLYPSKCDEDPQAMGITGVGMYHCPDCGAMLLAGLPHPPVCLLCADRMKPGYDILPEENL